MINKGKNYKNLLLNKLGNSGWELVSRDETIDWWLEEFWTVKSIRQSYGERLHILFLIDPMCTGAETTPVVWAVMAVKDMPDKRPSSNEGIIFMHMQKGKFDQKLDAFVQAINKYRNDI